MTLLARSIRLRPGNLVETPLLMVHAMASRVNPFSHKMCFLPVEKTFNVLWWETSFDKKLVGHNHNSFLPVEQWNCSVNSSICPPHLARISFPSRQFSSGIKSNMLKHGCFPSRSLFKWDPKFSVPWNAFSMNFSCWSPVKPFLLCVSSLHSTATRPRVSCTRQSGNFWPFFLGGILSLWRSINVDNTVRDTWYLCAVTRKLRVELPQS